MDEKKPHTIEEALEERGMANSTVLTMLVCLLDNGLAETCTIHEWKEWEALAYAVTNAVGSTDEARFCLYDYLDAIINAPYPVDRKELLREAETLPKTFAARIVEMAEEKRRTYSYEN